ncbi:MAG TPA: hypothetical protein VMT87_10440 [Vicinamibacteria bacterium]|nr:hypothetical protein [Vicinamibacteria bacterium]
MRTMAWAVSLTLASATLFAQEPAERPDGDVFQEEDAAARPEPLHRIRVLDHPYDLASFYRSRQGSEFHPGSSERYPIASFYRSRQSSPYGRFWALGYGAGDRGGRSLFRRSIGDNGDLYLFAPVVLAPVGPLSGAFLEPR